MPTTVNINSNYRGRVEAGPIIHAAFSEADVLDKGLFTIISDIEGSTYVRKIQVGTNLQNYACGWLPNGSVILSEQPLNPKKLMLEEELCKEDFRGNLWDSYTAGPSAWSNGLPTITREAIVENIVKKVGAEVERQLFYGDATVNGEFDGIFTQFGVSGATSPIRVSGTTITPQNVIAEMTKVLLALPKEIRMKESTTLLVSSDVALAYSLALGALGYRDEYYVNDGQFRVFNGIRFEVSDILEDSTMFAFQKENVFVGVNLLADFNELRILDMDEHDLSGTVRMKMVFAADTAVAYPAETVLYQG